MRLDVPAIGFALLLTACAGSDTSSPEPPPSRLAFQVEPSTTSAGQTITPSVQVSIQDANGNPVATAANPVTLSLTARPSGNVLRGTTTATATGGVAVFDDLEISEPGAGLTLRASADGLEPATSAAFDVTAQHGIAAAVAPAAGDGQTATVGHGVATSPSVRVTDAYGVAVAGVAVTFAVDSVGAVAGASATGLQQTTDGEGIATVGGWTLGTAAGQYTLVATSPGLHASPATIHATAVAGPATAMSLASGDAQVASLDSPVADPPTVFVSDAFGNGVPGVGVTFAVTAGGGSVTGSSQITDAQGLAAAESWKLGGAAGSNRLKASSAGLNGSPVTFHATAMVFALAAVVEVHDDYFLSVRNGSGGNPTLFGSRAVDTIAVGGTVSWQWVGSGHNVTPTAASAFKASGTQSAPFTFGPVTFDRPGTYGYRCTNHSRVVNFFGLIGMLGVIVVR